MRLDFNVLWVENQQDSVMAQKEKLDLQIRKEGFRLQVEFAKSVEDALKLVASDVYTDHIDLILMDFDLGSGMNGAQGLVEMRAKMPYREMIFYSAQADNLLEMVSQSRVQGVYCSHRTELPDAAAGIFEALVKKVIDIDHSRGIVMGTTSDIDHFIMDCLTALFDIGNDEARTATLGLIKEKMATKRAEFEKDADAVETITHINDLFAFHGVYTSVDRLELLRKILKSGGGKDAAQAALKKYLSAVPKRNDLAHVRVQVEGFKRKLVNRKNEEHTSESMKAFRLELLEHYESISAIAAEFLALQKKN
jgi:hypothetical protein